MQQNTLTQTTVPAYTRFIVIVPQFSQWFGARVVKDGNLDSPDLPTAKLGSGYLVDPKRLRPFVTLRKHVFNTLTAFGARFLSGYAVPESVAPLVMSRLDELQMRFEREKYKFLSFYERSVQEWAEKNPEFAEAILADKLPVDDVAARFSSGYSAVKLAPLPRKENELELSVRELAGQLLAETIKAAQSAHAGFISGHNNCSPYLRRRLVRIAEKLESMSFVREDIGRLSASVSDMLREIPEGALTGCDFQNAKRLVESLMSLDAMRPLIDEHPEQEVALLHASVLPTSGAQTRYRVFA